MGISCFGMPLFFCCGDFLNQEKNFYLSRGNAKFIKILYFNRLIIHWIVCKLRL